MRKEIRFPRKIQSRPEEILMPRKAAFANSLPMHGNEKGVSLNDPTWARQVVVAPLFIAVILATEIKQICGVIFNLTKNDLFVDCCYSWQRAIDFIDFCGLSCTH